MLSAFLDDTEVVTAATAREALTLLAEGTFDVVVSDLMMPEISGAELLARVSQVAPMTARVVVSGFADEITIAKCLLAAHRYFVKPFDPVELMKGIESLNRARAAAPRMEIRRLVGKLDTLPTPSETYLQLMQALNSPHKALSEISGIVEADPSLAAKVLQAVNSAMFGAGRRIVSLTDALQLIGLHVLRALVLTIQVFDFYQNPRLKSELKRLWRHSAEVARNARQVCLARKWPGAVADEAFLCGLLHDIGRLILAATPEASRARLFPEYRFFREEGGECPMSRLIEAEAGTYLLSLWGIPESIVTAVHEHATCTCRPPQSAQEPSTGAALTLAHEMEAAVFPQSATAARLAKSILIISENEALVEAIIAQCTLKNRFHMVASNLPEAFQTFHDLQFDIAIVDPHLFPYPAEQVEAHLRQVNANTNIRLLSGAQDSAEEYLDIFEGAVAVGAGCD